MVSDPIINSLTFQLRNIAFLRFERVSEYHNVISPFSRIYLVTEGEGCLSMANGKISLEPGYLFLIPGFTPCTYVFQPGLGHYYIHLDPSIQNGLDVFNIYTILNKASASELDVLLFSRLLEINPGMELPHDNPKVYQNKPWVNKKVEYQSVNQHLETIGIISQLFSRFLVHEQAHPATGFIRYNIQPILQTIQNHLHKELTMNELSRMACFSKDHFTRVFRSIMGMPPCEYIIRKRIEKAQLLLLTTDLSHGQIMEETGIRNASYFSRVFKKYTSYAPAAYRKQRG
jgi:AraC-like DNA-binding protein